MVCWSAPAARPDSVASNSAVMISLRATTSLSLSIQRGSSLATMISCHVVMWDWHLSAGSSRSSSPHAFRRGIRTLFSGGSASNWDPRDKGPQWLPSSHGSRGWDAGGGDNCEDPSRLFCSRSADRGDLPRAWRIAQGGPQGHPFRKIIRSEATEFRYERERQPLPKMGPWSAELDRLLATNGSKAARERLTLIRLFEELRGLGYAGGYDAVRCYARR
jgi:hypothetical protein